MSAPENLIGRTAADDWGPFVLADERLGRRGAVLTASGELDIATVPEFRDRLTRWVDAGVDRLVLDLRGVGFMDSVAMAAIIHTRTQLGDAGRMAVVLDGDSYTRLVFEIAGLPRCLELYETREEAAAALGL
ncbi:MAG: STAS domain-containing protein [Solirubrobacteraceae bacterium]